MARYTDASCKLCRREGGKLFLKGARCYTGKCGVERRSYAPGQHGQGRKKLSDYGVHLREKQKAKRFYGVLEKQFHAYFKKAEKQQGISGDNLLRLLESRLDNVVYRMGFAMSRAQARQLVHHGHFEVNGRKVDIPSYIVKAGDLIAVKSRSRDISLIKAVIETNESRPSPDWLEIDGANMMAKVSRLPTKDDIDLPIEANLIVEFYSK